MKTLPLIVLLSLCRALFAESLIREGRCWQENNLWLADLRTSIFLGQDPIDALKSGIMLYFNYTIVFEPQDQWFGDKKTIQHELRLRYNHITQAYIVENPITLREQSFPTIEGALATIGQLRSLPLIDQALLSPDERYTIAIRLNLAEDKLPVSLRLTALFSSEWEISSDWWNCPIHL